MFTSQKGNSLIFVLLGVLVLALIGGAYYYGKQSSNSTIQPEQSLVINPSPTLDPTSNWKVYTNTINGFSIKYPQDWTVSEAKDNQGVAYRLDLSGNQGSVHVTWGSGFGGGVCPGPNIDLQTQAGIVNLCETQLSKSIHATGSDFSMSWGSNSQSSKGILKSGNIYYKLEATANAPYESNKNDILDVLSTFKFNEPIVSSTPASSSAKTYVVPSSWKKWSSYKGDFSFYLPPDWNTDGSNIYYQRDAGFKPLRAIFYVESTNGQSISDQYISEYTMGEEASCAPEIKDNTNITTLNINGQNVTKIVPVDFQKPCTVNPALVFIRNSQLYQIQLNHGEGGTLTFFNDPNYLNDFYIIIASIK